MSETRTRNSDYRWMIPNAVACLLASLLAFVLFAHDLAAQVKVTGMPGTKHAGEFVVPVNQSQVLRVDVPFSNLLIGNPKIADVLALTNRSIYILGKTLGTTSLIISDGKKQPIAVMDIVVSHDIEGLKRRLFEVMPKEKIEVRDVNGSIILSGTVSAATRAEQAHEVAQRYAPDPAKVLNHLSVMGSQQVMLDVRFAEVQRTVVKQLGLNTGAGNSDVSIASGDALLNGFFAATSFVTGVSSFRIGEATIDLLFDALEEKGVVKTLAEPNLIALSGDTASFLAGGEFPVPVAQDTGEGGNKAITIEFKEFGVSLSFTPTVLDQGLINVLVAPEVSKIDRSNAVTISGFNIPGLTTRRAKTTVELRDGQSFAIAGLIQSDFDDTIRQFPGIGDVPVLGALFRSTDFNRDETELVIIVTPHLVKPAEPGSLRTPVDTFAPPSDAAMYLLGKTESRSKGASGAVSPTAQGAGGIKGKFGHIVK